MFSVHRTNNFRFESKKDLPIVMGDLQLELSFSEDSGPDDPQSRDESDDDIDSSGMEEVEDGEDSDASDTVEETVEQPPPPPGPHSGLKWGVRVVPINFGLGWIENGW